MRCNSEKRGLLSIFILNRYKTPDRCLTAIGNAGYEILDYIPDKYKTDESFMLEEIARDEYSPLKLDQSIWDKPKHFWIQAINKNPLSIVMVPKQYKDIHMSTIAVAMNAEALAYIPKDGWTKERSNPMNNFQVSSILIRDFAFSTVYL